MDIQTAFWILIVIICVELLALYVIGSSIKSTLQSDYFKKKMDVVNRRNKEEKERKGSGPSSVILLLIMSILPGLSFAISVDSQASSEPWIHVTEGMLYVLFTVALILSMILLYLKNLLSSLLNIDKTEEELVVQKEAKTSKFIHILTDAVPIDQEELVATDHEYDGIRELDNNLPPWWVWGFYATIIFAFVYLVRFHVVKTGNLQAAEYEQSMIEEDKKVAAYLADQKMNVDENSVVFVSEKADLDAGKKLFNQYCKVCHTESGKGLVGPNLTDEYWIHGGSIRNIFKTIKYGAQNGMKSWKDELNPIQMQQVSSYIIQLEEVSHANGGKKPEGDKYVATE